MALVTVRRNRALSRMSPRWTEALRPWTRVALIAALASGAACRDEAQAEPPAVVAAEAEPDTSAPEPAPGLEAATRGAVVAPPEAVLEAARAADVTPGEAPAKPAPTYLVASIEGSLEASIVGQTEQRLGAQLTQVAKRVLVWWVDVRRDLRRGDRIELVYETREDQEPIIHAIWLRSAKLGRTLSAVRYQAKGDRFARWYDDKGFEIEERLKHGPIADYEQITSLLRDGRRHKGVDFKAPVGEPILAPFDGRVVRRNWSFRRNGNCLQIVDARGRVDAYFLHLDGIDKKMRPGVRVKRGQVLARSGNTGRSTAPHLHYQLERSGRVIDPFRFHETWRKRLPESERGAAQAALTRWGELRTRSS